MLVTVTGCTDLERRLASLDFSKKGSGKSAGGSSFLFAVLSCARSRPLYRRRPRRPSGKSNNATCRFRLIYSRYPLEGPSTCKARVVICSHLERIGLRSPRSRKSLSRRASSTPSPLPSSSSLPSSPSPPHSPPQAVRFVFASVLCILRRRNSSLPARRFGASRRKAYLVSTVPSFIGTRLLSPTFASRGDVGTGESESNLEPIRQTFLVSVNDICIVYRNIFSSFRIFLPFRNPCTVI